MITTIQNDWADWEPSKSWDAATFTQLIRNAIDYGHYGVGLDIVDTALVQHPGNLELRYLKALCCSRSHAQCVPLLEALLNEPALSVDLRGDALALEGRLYKNQCLYAVGDARISAAQLSAARYESALELADDDGQRYFFAINAGSMHLLAGNASESQAHAEAAIAACEASGIDNNDYWKLATLGEAACLLGDLQQSHRWYSKARQAAGNRFGNVGSMRSQLQMLSGVRDVTPLLDDALALPKVAAFAGHMIDAAGAEPRFPASAESSVAASIAQVLQEQNVAFGYSSAACGGDLLFIEALQAAGAETNITLPFAYDDFLETSVAYAGEQWPKRLQASLKKAASVHYATNERFLGDVVLFEYTNRLFMGSAILRAKQMATKPVLIAALREGSAEKTGGTQSTVAYWESLGLPHELIEIDAHEPGPIAPPAKQPASPSKPAENSSPSGPQMARQVRTILFADVTGFSRMGETEAPLFVEHFLGASAALLDKFEPAAEFVNTWGDGIYMVFETLEAGADFALALRDMVSQTDWTKVGLPDHTGIRIALHCGPVFPAVEPMTKRPNFFGTHVTRAARIEPVTMPGSVYLTEQAAFLLVSSPDQRFQCDDLGKVELAKKYGAEHIFRLRRTGEWE